MKRCISFSMCISLICALFVCTVPLWGQTSVNNILDLWNVRNNMGGTYSQNANINLAVTNPASISDWDTNAWYQLGNVVKYSDGFAYYCKQNLTSIDGTQDPGNTSYWAKMWESSKGWEPIGNSTTPFYGVYEGNGNIIYNLYINRGASSTNNDVYPSDGEDNVGLFGYVTNGSGATSGTANNYNVFIRNLGLIDPNVTGRRATGTLVGRVLLPNTLPARSYTVYVERCYAIPSGSENTALVKGFGPTGGLVGANNSNAKQRVPVIRLCYTKVNVSATHPNNYTPNPNDRIGTSNVYNPYNIKYGGLVGCNENGITQDSFARGNVSGGDRVGGLAGCTIGGAIFRSYATGAPTRNIQPGGSLPNYQGGVGGVVGLTSGSLPPGLGGTNATGSCENCFWDTQTSGIATSPGGSGRNTTQMKTQSTFTNWDFVNVWKIDSEINNGYPFFIGSPSTEFYYRTKNSGNWNDVDTWQYSANGENWSDAVVTPDESNSISILIRNTHTVTITADVYVDATTIESGGLVKINSGKTLYVDNGLGTDITINGILEITGSFVVGSSALATAGEDSNIVFNGSTMQSTGIGFPSPVYNITVNNSSGLHFDESIQIDGTLEVLSGTYTTDQVVVTDGLYSPEVKFLAFPKTNYNIQNYGANTSIQANFPNFIDRQWVIDGFISEISATNRTKTITFYWTESDDHGFDWIANNAVPALYRGSNRVSGNENYNVGLYPRYLTVKIEFTNAKHGSKDTYKIGRDDELVLPIQLSSFNATVYNGNSVMLQWATQTETNLAGFKIYRGTSNEILTAMQLNVFISGTNTSQIQQYSFRDTELFEQGDYFYWLESVDYNLHTQLYGPISVTYQSGTENIPQMQYKLGISSIYPNPFNPNTTIRFGLTNYCHVKIEIFNTKGQKVRTLCDAHREYGNQSLLWDGKGDNNESLPTGMYMVKMTADGKIFNKKVMLMK